MTEDAIREAVARAICVAVGDDPDRVRERLFGYDDVAQAAITAYEKARGVECLRLALQEMVYETTHLSPCKPNGDHDCTISARALQGARDALAK